VLCYRASAPAHRRVDESPLSSDTIFRSHDPPPPNSTIVFPSTVIHGLNQTGSQIFEPFFSFLKLQRQTLRCCSDLRCRWGGARATRSGRPSQVRTRPYPESFLEKSLHSGLATTVSSCRPNLIKHSFERLGNSQDPQEWRHRLDPDSGTALLLLLSPRFSLCRIRMQLSWKSCTSDHI
jgi:hypothetical protein